MRNVVEDSSSAHHDAALGPPRRHLDLYCLATSVLTVAWWLGVLNTDWVGPMTLGKAFEPRGQALLLLGDLFSGVALPIAVLIAVRKLPMLAPALLWMHFGGQAYAFCVSVVGAIVDPGARWGVVAMFLASGLALVFAVRGSQLPILWGPFRFADAPQASARQLGARTMRQTAAMWLTFFAGIPAMLVGIEAVFGWRAPQPLALPIAAGWIALFIAGGVMGIASGFAMANHGEGTPLPSAGTRKLVATGPYRFVRNPMAVAAVIQGVALGCVLQSGLVVAYALLGGAAWETLVRPLEEEHLVAKFGEPYREYRDKVRCWLPTGRFG